MTKEQNEFLNEYLVNTFNNILLLEQEILKKIGTKNISVREIHVLEAIANAEQHGTNTMKAVAEKLCISPGALSTSVNTLVKKGYIIRKGNEKDRRLVHIFLTEKAKEINEVHEQIHFDMVEKIGSQLNDEQIKCLIASLITIKKYFYGEISGKKHKVTKIMEEEQSKWKDTAMK